MKKGIKIALIVCGVGLALIIGVQLLVFGMFVIATKNIEREGELLAKQGIEYAKVHLEEKYPNIEYTITDAETEELYNGFTHGGWGDTVEVDVEINGQEYKVYANIGDDYSGMCCDNFQAKEIKGAIRKKLISISGLTGDYELELDMSQYWQDYSFYSKFNGNITEFLIKEKELVEKYDKFNWEMTAHIGYADKEEKFIVTEDDAKFLELFKIVAFVNFKDKIPSTMYSYYNGRDIVKVLWDRNIPFNSVWVYSKSSKLFEEISHTMTRTAVV